jgi:toxin ParE1/3/4
MSVPFSVELTEGALADLAAIGEWLATQAGRDVAVRMIDAVLEKVATLEHFPARGGVVPELAALGIDRYRQMPVGVYRMIYRIDETRVTIRLIAHARRDLAALLEERLLRGGERGRPV